ncbi:MAG TPA: IclR family transcriptional regulator [Solirubrobacteraceae bacterium]|jgi:DNA-binding IclR family transcriptional regulator
MSDRDRVQSVDRAIDILMTLVVGPKTLTEVCRATDLTKGTAFRLLRSLADRGIVVKDPGRDNLYMLGPSLLRIAQGVTLGLGALGTIAAPVLTRVAEQTQETVTVHVRMGVERICIHVIPSASALRYTVSPGSKAPLHVGAAGQALIAFLDEVELEQVLASLPRPLEAITDDTVTDLPTLREKLMEVRERGYAISSGERVSGAAAVSVPIRAHGEFVAALSILGPLTRLPLERLEEFAVVLQDAAAEAGGILDGRQVAATDGAGG